MDRCCVQSPSSLGLAPGRSEAGTARKAQLGQHRDHPVELSTIDFIKVGAGSFAMGSADFDANPQDFEGPVREVFLDHFEISSTPITNCQFAQFAFATGYETEAEKSGWSFVFHLLISKDSDVIGQSRTSPWWLGVSGASWRNPAGAGSSYQSLLEHPAVHISYLDAVAFCEWADFRLPDEQQWEKSARGGLPSQRFPWGNELTPEGRWHCNIFQGSFPSENDASDGWLGTSPVRSYPPNGLGGYDFSGNVWEWTATDFSTANGAETGIGDVGDKVTRGGSYLCHDSYCNRYRVGARNKTPADAIAGNIGFRVVRVAE